MYARVTRDQFEIGEEAIIHRPTGAEFTPILGTSDSAMIWTGEIGARLSTGETYDYADVMAMLRTLRQEHFAVPQR
jgi:hypothetical protein